MTPIKQQAITQQTAEKLEQVLKTRSPPILAACFGVMCKKHSDCARWRAVVTWGPDHPRQATCLDSEGKMAGFVEVQA